jgi:hypothetical protein
LGFSNNEFGFSRSLSVKRRSFTWRPNFNKPYIVH